MCDYDEWVFRCGHSAVRLKNYCHDARNAPGHRCFFVKRLKNVWYQAKECEECIAKRIANGEEPSQGGGSQAA